MGPDLWLFEKKAIKKGFLKIAGIDEAGRGPLAGPVVSAAVVLPPSFQVPGICDSKKLTPKKRNYFYEKIYELAVSIGIGIVDPPEIDRINILQASLMSMAMAAENLAPQPDCLLIDGIFTVSSALPQEPIPKGDGLSISIAAASIKYHQYYPLFGFSRHKGYPTKAHKAAISKYGCCPIHRRSFKGVREHL